MNEQFELYQRVWYHTTATGWKYPVKYPAHVIKYNTKTGKYTLRVAISPHEDRRVFVTPDKISERDETFVALGRDSF